MPALELPFIEAVLRLAAGWEVISRKRRALLPALSSRYAPAEGLSYAGGDVIGRRERRKGVSACLTVSARRTRKDVRRRVHGR